MYRSLAQEHLFHSPNSPVSKKVVAEFDAATKGHHLPMHAAFGGEVSEADARLAHVLSGGHLPDPDGEIVTCPACGHTFSEAEDDHFSMEPESTDPLAMLADALRAGGY